jgi:hypothetical protein
VADNQPFENWQSILAAPRSEFFRGHTTDTVFDRAFHPGLIPMTEAMFTQSNARVLIGQSANGTLRMIALPTQVYPAPTDSSEYGLGPGMYHHFDVAMYAGDLSYRIEVEGGAESIDLASPERENETWYADYFLPLTQAQQGDLDCTLFSFAPVAANADRAALAPAPLPGPAGAFYILHVQNTGSQTLRGKVVLRASDMLVGHYEDSEPNMRAFKRPTVDLRQHALILTRPEGAVGVHLHDGKWTRLEAPFEAEKSFSLAPGSSTTFETYLAIGASFMQVMPEMYALHLRSPLDWLNLTARFWRSRLGQLAVGPDEQARFSREIYIRSLFDNFNCLQTDASGNLISHWQGAPSHGYGTVWGIDVEPTAVSVVHLCPEITRQAMIFFMTRSRVPRGPADHSVPILVAPLVIARQWLQVTGDVAFLKAHPEIMEALEGIARDLLALKAPGEMLFPSRYSSDGPVGRRYDYGTNVKVWYTFDSLAYLLEKTDRAGEAGQYRQIAADLRQAVRRTMVAEGPFGLQISGGTNLGEDPKFFYLPEEALYYDGEDTSSMLAPIYGFTGFEDEAWINYHRFARSLWCTHYDPEFETLMWAPSEPAVLDGTAYVSRLAGSVTRTEMREALEIIREMHADLATGSLFWWPHGKDFRRGITRCSQGQGAWAWQYLNQWLGLTVDAPSRTLTVAPLGYLNRVDWQDFVAGPYCFEIHWQENAQGMQARVRNQNAEPWTVRFGVRPLGSGAEGPVAWKTLQAAAGEEVAFSGQAAAVQAMPDLLEPDMIRAEARSFADAEGVLFKRFGPAMMWGNWDGLKLWDFSVMPLQLRFVILNASEVDWRDVTVTLASPDGWLSQPRQPGCWSRADHLKAGEVSQELGALAAPGQMVASFWIQANTVHQFVFDWNRPDKPFHKLSQPGEGIQVIASNLHVPVHTEFTVQLSATTRDGKRILRKLVVPLQIDPIQG